MFLQCHPVMHKKSYLLPTFPANGQEMMTASSPNPQLGWWSSWSCSAKSPERRHWRKMIINRRSLNATQKTSGAFLLDRAPELNKPTEARYCSREFPISTEENLQTQVNGNPLSLSQFSKLQKGKVENLKTDHKTLSAFDRRMVGFASNHFGTDGWKSNQPLVGFPSTGWISI